MTTLIVLFAIATSQIPSPQKSAQMAKRAADQTPPPGWTEAARTMSALGLDQKCQEVIALGEQWVAKHPSFAEAHLRLGGAYDGAARGPCVGRARIDRAERTKLFEKAAVHMRRGFELGGGETPWITIRGLIDLYGVVALNRPDEQEQIAREAVVRYPAEPVAHVELITSLLRKGAEPEAIKAAAAARASLPKAAEPRFDMASRLAFRVTGGDPIDKLTLTRETRQAMARIALGMMDDVLAISPGHRQALREKAELVRAQAELVNEPPLSASARPAHEPGVRSMLRAIVSAQVMYSADCAARFYAPTLAALASPSPGGERSVLFSDVPPNGAWVIKEYGYAIEMTAPPSPKSPASCNGVPAGQSAETWSATARPLPGYSGKSFRIDTEGTLTEIK